MKLSKDDLPFTMVVNEVLRDASMSMKAKGLFSYLFSKPDGWDFSGDRIASEMSDGRHAVFSALKELEEKGYLERVRRPTGRVDYHIKYALTPMTEISIGLFEKPDAENRKGQKVHLAKISSVSKKDVPSKIVKESKKELSPVGDRGTSEFIFLFKEINPTIGVLYGRPPQRQATERLLKLHDFAWWESFMSGYIKRLAADKFCPRATTPLQLEAKLGAIMVYGHQQKTGSKVFTLA
jgi:hypothetical protein